MENQFLLDALIELTPQQLLVENDGISADGSLLLSSSNQPIVSNQTMVDLGKKLLQAASENDVENVKALMTGGAPFTGNWLGTTPLHAAAKAGHIDTVELLLKAGIFRDAKTKVDRTALQMAAEEGHTAIVLMLIEHSADVNSKDMLKMTALHWAVERGHMETVSVLLEHGADVATLNKFDKTPIDIACENGFTDILQILEAAVDRKASKDTLVESETAAEELMNELAAVDKIRSSWKHSPEEEALEKLTASTIANESSTKEAVKLLESHGITLLPVDTSTLLTSALESGQTISLTEAGKLALNQTKQPTATVKPTDSCSPPKKMKISSGCTVNVSLKNSISGIQNPRVVTMTAEQFLALATAGKVHQSKSSKPMVITLPKKLTGEKNVTATGSGTSVFSQIARSPTKTITTIGKKELVNSLAQLLSSQTAASVKSTSSNSIKVVNNETTKPPIGIINLPGRTLKKTPIKSFTVSPTPKTVPPSVQTVQSPRFATHASLAKSTSSVQASLEPLEAAATKATVSKLSEQSNPSTGTLDRDHFMKSGLLKGSARTTPIALLCRKEKSVSSDVSSSTYENDSDTCKEPSLLPAAVTPKIVEMQLPLPAVALNTDLSLNDNLFNEDSGEGTNAVWLSIMEEDNSQFTSGNDEDLLDPTRLAAQLASIKQAASRFSFSN